MSTSPLSEPSKRRPSITDVARLAGVSPQTVSRVSTGAASVRPETKERVLTAMNQLGYSPNYAARALRGGAFKSIGVLTQSLERTGESLTLAALVHAAERHGYSTMIAQVSNPEADRLSATIQRISTSHVDGLVIIRSGSTDYATLSLPANFPVIAADRSLTGHYPIVMVDQSVGTRQVVQHLLDLGHRTVYHIAGHTDSVAAAIRTATWKRTLAEAGIPAPPEIQGDWTTESGYHAGKILAQDPRVTAVFCGNDEMAFGAIHAFQEAGLRVPQDISVAGFDDISLSAYSFPPLTTVFQDFTRLGDALVERLLTDIESGASMVPDMTLYPSHAVIRESTVPPSPQRV